MIINCKHINIKVNKCGADILFEVISFPATILTYNYYPELIRNIYLTTLKNATCAIN